MIDNLINKWINKYLAHDILEFLNNCESIYDALLVELADCSKFSQATIVMNHCAVSKIAIKEALYITLAHWGEQEEYSYFIDTCIKRLGYLTPQNAPALLTHIMIGGAYPYLVPALKLNFIRDKQDFTISRQVYYGPDLREYPECMWCDFVDWVDETKEHLGAQYYPSITIDLNGMKITKPVKRKYLRTRGFCELDNADNWVPTYFNMSTWKKKFEYFSSHTKSRA